MEALFIVTHENACSSFPFFFLDVFEPKTVFFSIEREMNSVTLQLFYILSTNYLKMTLQFLAQLLLSI